MNPNLKGYEGNDLLLTCQKAYFKILLFWTFTKKYWGYVLDPIAHKCGTHCGTNGPL
jgi:hypothetical protein